jgi:hypothetical protein
MADTAEDRFREMVATRTPKRTPRPGLPRTSVYPWFPWFAQTLDRAVRIIRDQGFGASILYHPGPPETVKIEVDTGDTGRDPTPVQRRFVGHPDGIVVEIHVPEGAEDGVDAWGHFPATEDEIFRFLRYWLVKRLPPYREVWASTTRAEA